MSVDLTRLPADEEMLRSFGKDTGRAYIQNVLDGLNYYRCLARHCREELVRANAELIEVRNSAHHDRIFGEFRS